ncbi:helix-turn-helix domain-containing protein [Shimia sp. R10_1]|uniref:helix-turn-helix domain-containing protein n=1 Tax=Shimia sp. R10_1 TaxID=2821095 RepID=UPI0032AEC4DB
MDLARHERIKYDLRLLGTSLAQISRELGVSISSVSTVSQGYRRSERIQKAIAVQLGTSPEVLWPERYQTGPVTFLCRPKSFFRPLFSRKRRGFSNPMPTTRCATSTCPVIPTWAMVGCGLALHSAI